MEKSEYANGNKKAKILCGEYVGGECISLSQNVSKLLLQYPLKAHTQIILTFASLSLEIF